MDVRKRTEPTSNHVHDGDEERVGIVRIKLNHTNRSSTAILRSFNAADRLLASWASEYEENFGYSYEILYIDGRVLYGEFKRKRKSTLKHSLSSQVRALLSSTGEQINSHLQPNEMGINTQEQSLPPLDSIHFLQLYEIDDFRREKT